MLNINSYLFSPLLKVVHSDMICILSRCFLFVYLRESDLLHVEGQRFSASGLRLGPPQHYVGVAHLAGVDIGGRKRNSNLTCTAKMCGGKNEEKTRQEGAAAAAFLHASS